jgi:hypothetical protein
MAREIDPVKKSENLSSQPAGEGLSPSPDGLIASRYFKHGKGLTDSPNSKASADAPERSSEVLSAPSKSNSEPEIRQGVSSAQRTASPPSPESSKAEQQLLSHGQTQKPPVEFKGLGPSTETGKSSALAREDDGNKSFSEAQSPQRVQDSPLAKTPPQPSFLPESLTGQRPKEPDASLIIPPLRREGYLEPRRGDSTDHPIPRIKPGDAQPQAPVSQISLGDLAKKLNQGDVQKSSSQPPIGSETHSARTNEGTQSIQKGLLVPGTEGPKSSGNNETAKPVLNSIDQSQHHHHEIPPVRTAAQSEPAASEKSLPPASPPLLTGQISSAKDKAHDASPATNANRPGSISPERPDASDKPRNDADQKSRIDTSVTERSTKADVGRAESTDAKRVAKPDGVAVHFSGSDVIKSNRVETQSTDKSGKTDKSDATKPHEDTKHRPEISNQTKREPLIIPGVITSRISDGGKGSKGTKADSSGKSDTKNPDTKTADSTNGDSKKVDRGTASIKNGGTVSDATSGRKDTIKIDKSDEKSDQRADTNIAASTSNVISGVAGRIADGLSSIKDKLIPGAKTKVDSQTERADGHSEFANHAAQPKPNDAGLGIGRDLKGSLPSPNSEFVYNGKKPLSDSREETLSIKTGGLKQALVHIFGNHPDIALDLKANTFPGPKTVPFENTKSRPDERQNPKGADGADKLPAKKTSKIDEPGFLRNQKGDKVPTGDLHEHLAELKANPDLTKADDAGVKLENKNTEVDLTSRQQITDFTVQLGEIAIGAASVPASEFFTTDDTIEQTATTAADDDVYDSRYLYYVKEGDTLRSIFDSQLPHQIGNAAAFDYFVKTNEQTVRLASVLSADSMSFILQPGTVLKLPTPGQIARLKS